MRTRPDRTAKMAKVVSPWQNSISPFARNIDDQRLCAMLDKIGAVRAKLRYVHQATHLKTPAVMSNRQIDDYNRLRGYGDAAATPKKH
jgi:hypothetical protein